jgi:HK97 family phage prohead protease
VKMSIIHKTNDAGFDAGLGCILSDTTVDAYGDVVGNPADPNLGWDTKDFMRNPIALWSHDSRSPIGTWRDVGVTNGALRGRLHLAPSGSTKLVDELKALLAAGVLKGISVGFSPIEYGPRKGGIHYLKQKLVEASLVSVPANPSALLTAKALGISKETSQKIFKSTETSSNAQRLRDYPRSIRNLKDRIARETNPKSRASMMRSLGHLEKAEREMSASLQSGMSDADRRRASQQLRARAEAAQDREIDRLIAEYENSWAGQMQRQRDETIENWTRAQQRMGIPQDPPPFVPSEGGYGTWRGVKLPGPKWRGKPIR